MCSAHEIDKQTEKQAGYKKISWFMGGLTKKRETTHYNFFSKTTTHYIWSKKEIKRPKKTKHFAWERQLGLTGVQFATKTEVSLGSISHLNENTSIIRPTSVASKRESTDTALIPLSWPSKFEGGWNRQTPEWWRCIRILLSLAFFLMGTCRECWVISDNTSNKVRRGRIYMEG